MIAKQPPKGPQHDADGNTGPRQQLGIFIGYCTNSNCYRVILDNGQYISSRSLRRRPMADRWSPDELANVQSTPWDLRTTTEPERVDLGEAVPRDAALGDPALPTARRLKITKKVLDEFGYTESCPQCGHYRAFGQNKNGLMHSEACRTRIVTAMEGTAAGAAKPDDVRVRMDRALLAPDATMVPRTAPSLVVSQLWGIH